jgi:hypothetical protein
MDELDLFRDFRSGVAAPSGDVHRRASARLISALDSESAPGITALRLIRTRPGYTALALAAIAGATAAALFVSTPWNNSSGFLERAEAALATNPATVLHVISEETYTSTDPACSVTRGPNETWIDQTPPHRFRAVQESHTPDSAVDPRRWVCSSGTIGELRGTLDSRRALWFVPPGAENGSLVLDSRPHDPVQALRDAINAGRAHDEGETELNGRIVKRIRVDAPFNCPDPCPHDPFYTYVDPDSFYPVEERGFTGIWSAPPPSPGNEFPENPVAAKRLARFHVVRRYLTFEYLPRTAANLALTGAQQPPEQNESERG